MKRKVIWLVVSGLMALALLAIACYPSPAKETAPVAPTAPAATEQAAPKEQVAPKEEASATEVKISGSAFVPATVTVAVGTTVTWSNQDSVVHTVSSQSTLFDSGNLSRGATFSHTFNQPGTFEYRCKIHPAMKAKVIVE